MTVNWSDRKDEQTGEMVLDSDLTIEHLNDQTLDRKLHIRTYGKLDRRPKLDVMWDPHVNLVVAIKNPGGTRDRGPDEMYRSAGINLNVEEAGALHRLLEDFLFRHDPQEPQDAD